MKKCGHCKELKEESEFNKNKRDKYQSYCKSCEHIASRNHYLKNKEVYIKRAKTRKQELLKFIREIRGELKCKQCNEDRPAALDFHHRDSSVKDYEIGYMASMGFSKEKILKEMEKCDVLCSNCHRVLHSEEKV